MHRIDGLYAVAGLFVDGDPESTPPVFPTYFTAKWCNAVQEEICNIIEKAALTLSDTDDTQLFKAINQSWVTFDITTGTPVVPVIVDHINGISVTRLGVGLFRVAWDNDFSNAVYNVQVTVGWNDSTTTPIIAIPHNHSTGYVEVALYDSSFSAVETVNIRVHVRATGDMTFS